MVRTHTCMITRSNRSRAKATSIFLGLLEELARLRAVMKRETEGAAEQDEAIGAVAAAEKAAGQGDGPNALRHLKAAGKWSFGIAEEIWVAVAVDAIKKAMQ